MDSCKSQMRNLQDAAKNPDSEAARHSRHLCNRHNWRLRHSRSRRAQRLSKDNTPVSGSRQKSTVSTIKGYIWGQRNMCEAQ
ncbi:hypothetical protein GGF37_002546 [Kickxella alabastrina]|nr:hypothetical protein GGF37_002546 [Kickxella alabastrina]